MFDTLKANLRLLVLKILKIYQKTLSFDHGIFKYMFPNGYCKFHPTCSEYAYLAIEKYGIIKGGIKAFWRVLIFNLFFIGGNDTLL